MKERTRLQGDRFILLADFWDGFRLLEVRHLSAEPFIRHSVQEPMYDAIRNAIPTVTILSIEELRKRANSVIEPEECVVTLDGGILWPSANFRIDITRAAESIRTSVEGPYRRVPRGMAPQLRQQAMSLRDVYSESQKRKLVLCDDGIGTGETIRRTNQLLQDLDLNVSRIITVTNPRKLDNVDGIPVTTIYPVDEQFIWLNERDLYWGLPRSGLSMHKADLFVALGGMPYTVSIEMARSRIGLPEAGVAEFRRTNLSLNKRLWRHLEALHGRTLTVKDCSRLQFFGDSLGNADLRIVDLIELAESDELESWLKSDE